jgi:hypothetical protein
VSYGIKQAESWEEKEVPQDGLTFCHELVQIQGVCLLVTSALCSYLSSQKSYNEQHK